jgi:hypothetical protein
MLTLDPILSPGTFSHMFGLVNLGKIGLKLSITRASLLHKSLVGFPISGVPHPLVGLETNE